MKTRKIGPKGPEVSALGFGCMRYPVKDGKIDRDLATPMMLEAWKSGVNYWDTAYPYHNGDSEVFLSEVFAAKGAPNREDIVLADKMPSWLVKNHDDLDRYFNEQLERLNTNYIDVYLLHTLDKTHWPEMKKAGALEWLADKKERGQIRYAGFSFHDGPEIFSEILQSWDWDVCQIQYNFMDVEEQAGLAGLKLADEKGVGVIVMEPLLGGNLVEAPPVVADIWAKSEKPEWTPVERALRWVWDQKEVGIVLSGMSTIDHVKENCRIAADSAISILSADEKSLFDQARTTYQSLKSIGCTDCKYCLPCPHDVNIPRNFAAYNQAVMYGNLDGARGEYNWMLTSFEKGLEKADPRAVNCISCGECEPKCPQGLEIGRLMPEVDLVLSGEKTPAEASI